MHRCLFINPNHIINVRNNIKMSEYISYYGGDISTQGIIPD